MQISLPMHLQSLELLGFKSFADKTIFNFHEGVTAIVGPNGCGKSNVLDATRWVLGEQSAKALRGGEMADVIFNGADSRKPVGFAEVSLTFTNCAQELGVDWHDVRVTRRVYRDGNSEYFLNKNGCRLKDIQSLFADTGVGRSAYSIMEQGKIDLILSSRPEDRRAIFEEAAGITKYRTQKREALRKLEATEANLLRIGDIIKEVKRQIGSLQRQAGKARRYQTLLTDLKVLDTHHSREQLGKLEADLENSRADSSRLTENERTTQAKIESGEDRLKEQRGDLDKIDARISDARGEVQRLQSEIAAHRNRIEFNQQRAQEFAELIERYTGDVESAETKRVQQETEIQEADALIEKTDRLLATKESELAELTERTAQLRDERSARETKLQTHQFSISTSEDRLAKIEEEMTGQTVRRETTAARVADLDGAISNTQQQFDETRTKLEKARANIQQETEVLRKLLSEAQTAEKELQETERRTIDSEKNLTALERDIAEKGSRLEVLRQLNEEGEGLAHGSQAVLRGLDEGANVQVALAGALASQLDVQHAYVAAIEAALGRNMHAIVLTNSELALKIIAKLTSKNLGQAALALADLVSTDDPTTTELPEGALAWAVDKVTAPDSLQLLVRRLLYRVAVSANLETALTLKKHAPTLSVATLGGEFISAEGILFGGRGSNTSDSLLERKARIKILADEKGVLENRRGTLADECAQAQNENGRAKNRLAESRERHQDAHLNHSTATGKNALIENELREAEQKLENLHTEKMTLDRQVATADEKIGVLNTDLETLRQNLGAEQSRCAELEKEREKARHEEEALVERLNEVRLAVATERQRHGHLVTQRQPMAAREAELSELIAARRGDIARYRERLSVQEQESLAAAEAIETQSAECANAEKNANAVADERSKQAAAVTALEAELRRVRDSLNDLRDLRGKQEVRQAQLQMQIENLVEHISRRYQVDLRAFSSDAFAFAKTFQVQLKRRMKQSEAPSDEDREETKSEPGIGAMEIDAVQVEQIVADLTKQLDNMGPVNLEAVQEYDELEERYRFLEAQNSDLTGSRRELLDVISRINDTTQKLFADTFAQVRMNFREMFGELFAGGRADLSLQDEKDSLNCGIEITAKPPGKQLQSISLLSGGERTMTAVALLFAIYMVRPSPFCILDEMDAALDESNINRFIRVLDRFVRQSQFIIITHNKHTIAKADILYGVTMEERGVSKLVGMKLTAPATAVQNGNAPSAAESKPTQSQFPLEGASRSKKLAATR